MPAATKVTVVPDTVQVLKEPEVNEGVKPASLVAETVNVPDPNTLELRVAKVIV